MTIKTREPGDAFKRQVSEFVPIAKKRRPWREEEALDESETDLKPEEAKPVREVQGATSSQADSALDEELLDVQFNGSSNAISARDEPLTLSSSTSAKFALDEEGNFNSSSQADIAQVGEKFSCVLEVPTRADIALVEDSDSSHQVTTKVQENQHNFEGTVFSTSAKFTRDENLTKYSSSQANFALVEDLESNASSSAKFALDEVKVNHIPSQAKSARDEPVNPTVSTQAKSALVETFLDSEKRDYLRYVRKQFRSLSIKETELQAEVLEPLPGTRKTRGSFVFDVALKRIDNPSAALLFCYLWHQTEEIGSAQLKITIAEMSEATNISRRTVTDSVRRLSELELFENVNNGKTTVPVVRLRFG